MERWEDLVRAAWREGQRRSVVGPGPVDVHFQHARALVTHLPPDARCGLDLGCGAGVPGLALAGLRPDMEWTLLDASRRRIALVQDAIAALGWQGRVEAVHARAEDSTLLGIDPVDVVVARLFGPPAVTAECAAPFLAQGGVLIVTEPPGPPDASRWPAEALAALGLEPLTRIAQPSAQLLTKVGDAEERFPRKPGVARKRPLW